MANRQIPCTRKCTWDLTHSIDSTNIPDSETSATAISTATTEAQSVRSKTASKESFRY